MRLRGSGAETAGRILINCNCWLSEVINNDYFKDYTPSPELLKQVQEDPRFPEFKAWATGWLSKMGMEVPTISRLSGMGIYDLRKIAREMGIEGADEMSKEELIKIIKKEPK